MSKSRSSVNTCDTPACAAKTATLASAKSNGRSRDFSTSARIHRVAAAPCDATANPPRSTHARKSSSACLPTRDPSKAQVSLRTAHVAINRKPGCFLRKSTTGPCHASSRSKSAISGPLSTTTAFRTGDLGIALAPAHGEVSLAAAVAPEEVLAGLVGGCRLPGEIFRERRLHHDALGHAPLGAAPGKRALQFGIEFYSEGHDRA